MDLPALLERPTVEQVEETIANSIVSNGNLRDAASAVMLLFSPQSESDARNAAINKLTPGKSKPADLVRAIAAVDRPTEPKEILQALSTQFFNLAGQRTVHKEVTLEVFAGIGSALAAISGRIEGKV